MGCDIHLHIEEKTNGIWQHIDEKEVDRAYCLFAKMANVRNYENRINPISLPKGLPDDVTEETVDDLCSPNNHSYSWLGSDELQQLYDWCTEEHPICIDDGLFSFNLDENGNLDENVRFVFAFDN
jgi:hypothetical protein